MEKEFIVIVLIISVVLIIVGYNIGSLVITDEVKVSVKRDICQAISVKTEDYINCNAKTIDDVIKVLPKIDKEIK